MKNALIFFFLTSILIFNTSISHAGWLIYHKPEFKGKVIDAESKEPIEGVVVVAIYKSHPIISGPGGGSSSIINIKEVLTDKNGEFHIPSYTTTIQPLSKEDNVDFIIYKPGYGSHPGEQVYPFNYFGPEYTFTKELGSKEEKHRGSNTIIVIHGIVELPRLKTREERLRAMPGHITEAIDKTPILNRLLDDEDKTLGIK